MMRSLYSAISGLKNHQTKMDVIGNNIANVNTTGFKRSRVTFSTMLSQTLRGASAPSAATTPGGTNAMQVGLGASLSSIDQIMTQGSAQSTGNDTDLMIQGPGFFVLTTNGIDRVYSRSGAFSLDANGYLVEPASGANVLDSNNKAIKIDPTLYSSFNIDKTGVITAINMAGNPVKLPEGIQLATFPNSAGLMSIGGSFYKVSNNSGTAIPYGVGGAIAKAYPSGTSLIPNAVEMSNVDLSQEFTDMIVAQRGFQANSRVITVSDSLLQELIDLKRN